MHFLFVTLFLLLAQFTIAQDTLPNFTAIKKKDGTAIISWINDYGIVKQITIQRSTDSVRNFASINTYANPMAKKGEFVDKKAKMVDFYYRVFVQLPEGNFFYTKSKKVQRLSEMPKEIRDSIIAKIDTIAVEKPKVFQPSEYIFTDKKNNIIVILPDAETKNYSIVFFDESGKQVLKVPRVKESNLILEKYNFYKSGWFTFEIFLDNKLFEKHQFLLVKERP